MNTTDTNTTRTFELGDRLTMRRAKGEVVKVILTTDDFYAPGDPRRDNLAVQDWLKRGWRITRVEKNYQPERKHD